ncbi:MAG: choice-of-anchor J domain-containing protein [Weeksellaceae bacterium]|nr:choice-of-anchor J domain-containing protein [Weeksellaceae bacterium]
MKRFLFCSGLLLASLAYGQVFQEDWDGNGPGIEAWTVIDVDGNTPAPVVSVVSDAWVVIDRGNPDFYVGGPAGNHAAVSTSWYAPPGTSDDWLITPLIELPEHAVQVKWEAKAQDGNFRDGYELRLAPNGGNTVEDFTVLLTSIDAENVIWTTRIISLEEYAGTSVRIAWRNNSTDDNLLLVDNIVVDTLQVQTPPACVTLLTPQDGVEDIASNDTLVFTWQPAEGEEVDFYTFSIGTTPEANLLSDATTDTSISISGLAPGTVYYWTVTAHNASGESQDCEVFSFRTIGSDVSPYCGPIFFHNVEPITYVDFAGINNTTSASMDSSPHEAFLDQVAQVVPGEMYTITLGGFTDGPYSNKFAVFIDWNQNGILDDAGEVYEVADLLTNSTGEDGVHITHTIAVPLDALPGETRMRIKKIYHTHSGLLDPCEQSGWGQAEDYTVNVGTLSTIDVAANSLIVYPNPATDVLNVKGLEISKATVFNTAGQQIAVQATREQVVVNHLLPGVYILQITDADGKLHTVKFIKK